MGEDEAAAERCKALLREKPSDASVAFAAANTLVAARGSKDLFDSHKRLRPYASGQVPVPPNASPEARATFRYNWAHTLCAMGKVDEAGKFLGDEAMGDAETCKCELLLFASRALAAAATGKKKKKKKQQQDQEAGPALDLVPVVEAARDACRARGVDVAFLDSKLAELLAAKGDYAAAERALAASSVADRLGVVAERAELLEKAGDVPAAVAVLKTAPVADADDAFAVAFHRLRLHDVDGAKEALGTVEEEGNEARLCLAAAFYDADEAARLAALLPDDPAEAEAEAVDAQALLDAPPPRSSRPRDAKLAKLATTLSPEEIEAAAELRRQAALKRRAKKRAAYLDALAAAGKYDPKHPAKPDPERWIPKAQRSYNKRGRKHKGGAAKISGAQGGASDAKDVLKLDAAERARAKKEADEKKAEQDAADAAAGLGGRKKGRQPRKRK